MAETPAQHATCVETTTVGDLPNRTYVCGQDCPRPAGPDADRDARIDAYRDRERRRATRALDRYVEVVMAERNGDLSAVPAIAADHLIEVVGDYVLARLGDTELNVQQKSHYGVPPGCTYDESIAAHRSMCPIDHGAQHNADSAGGGFRTRLDDRGYSTSEPRNPDSVSICYCDGAGRHIRGENCVARPAADPA